MWTQLPTWDPTERPCRDNMCDPHSFRTVLWFGEVCGNDVGSLQLVLRVDVPARLKWAARVKGGAVAATGKVVGRMMRLCRKGCLDFLASVIG